MVSGLCRVRGGHPGGSAVSPEALSGEIFSASRGNGGAGGGCNGRGGGGCDGC